jgi:hypothetical protein
MSEEKAFATLDGLASFMDASEVDGHPVKEWTTTQFQNLYPYLSGVTQSLAEGGATFSNLKSYLTSNWPKLVDAVAPHMVPIILISVPSVTKEYLDEQPFTRGLEFIILIFRKNIEHVADFFGLKAGLEESQAENEESATTEPTSKSSKHK